MLLALTLLAALHAAPATDSITGHWVIKGDVVGNAVNATCEMTQSGTALTGSCVGEKGDAHPITGQVTTGIITFQYESEYQGDAITVIYTAKLDTPTKMKGTILVKPFDANGTFTAEPAPAK
jgi:hypothetical protein